ncbi:hypothetical protein CC1G_08456 [Coprinopsis cinerea okayama7|uniref:FAD/NAD(P)-binding domain-containing protein n=2 Tax=Coprinopsis cinerea TaxID=5346 RepID=A8NLZ7_COPC7|nr:hypothetical protein CC1G_08456 [Coprinopsis cinerea okayama7\|eukprot:XP_001834811.1 hypothetical protein CC1G_08456 [Coprinopsis cinerea okayama7\
MSDKRQNIVIVGGGPGGSSAARAISTSKKFNGSTHRVILITARPYFTHLPAMIRTTVTSEGSIEKLALMNYGDFIPPDKGEVKVGKVVKITEDGKDQGGSVTLESGEVVRYSILVLATGNKWNGALDMPDDPKEMQANFDSWRAKFAKAKNIVLVGGGSVGLEYAGELRDFYPDAKVTIVHSQKQVLNDAYPDKFRKAVLARFQKEGVEIVLEDAVDQTEPVDGKITTRKGKSIPADLVLPAWGGRPNTAFIKESLGDDVLTSSGHVKVQPTLQLPGHARIFAVGDIIDWNEQKQAAKAPAHGAIVAANIVTLVSGSGALTEYKGSSEIILVTAGRNGGIAYLGILWGIVLGDWFARMLKSKGLVIEMSRGQYGFPAYKASA